MTQLLPRFGSSHLVLGFDRHDRFQHTFSFDLGQCPVNLTVLTLWDQKDRSTINSCKSERLFVIEGTEVEKSLRIGPTWLHRHRHYFPRLSTPNITGCVILVQPLFLR